MPSRKLSRAEAGALGGLAKAAGQPPIPKRLAAELRAAQADIEQGVAAYPRRAEVALRLNGLGVSWARIGELIGVPGVTVQVAADRWARRNR